MFVWVGCFIGIFQELKSNCDWFNQRITTWLKPKWQLLAAGEPMSWLNLERGGPYDFGPSAWCPQRGKTDQKTTKSSSNSAISGCVFQQPLADHRSGFSMIQHLFFHWWTPCGIPGKVEVRDFPQFVVSLRWEPSPHWKISLWMSLGSMRIATFSVEQWPCSKPGYFPYIGNAT